MQGWEDAVELGPVTVLTGVDKGTYPHGNSVLVRGTDRTALIDPSVLVYDKGGVPGVDLVLLSHCHEDHIPGLARFPDAEVHLHEADRVGLESLDGLLAIYGLPPGSSDQWAQALVDQFHYVPRPDALGFRDGDRFDLGGVQVEVVHTPGHTRGHSAFVIPEASAVFLGDIELTGFGPYYGDAWSDLVDFEASLERCRQLDLEHFITFHHKGVIHGRERFLEMLNAFASMIDKREAAMLEFLVEPRSLDDMVEHRFIYRPHVEALIVNPVERRSAQLHIERLLADGRLREVDAGRWQRV